MPNSWRRRLLLGGIALFMAGPALAHAVLVDSVPAQNGVLPAGHADVRLRFNSRIDQARSRVTLTGPAAENMVLQLGDSGQQQVLLCPAELAPGQYTLHWQVLAVDGHITRGTVPFTVNAEVTVKTGAGGN